MLRFTLALLVLLAAAIGLAPGAARASHCLAFVQQTPAFQTVRFASVAADSVEITYVGHSTFRLVTPQGVIIATDYAGNAGAGPVPDVVTMNHAHETHFTSFPDPAIEHVLRGWNPEGGPAEHLLKVGDVEIRNVTTDIRGWAGTVEPHGNSIFIFEVADLCIGHLGHLHQRLSDEQLALVGRLDVVFAPVDGSYTLDLGNMIKVLKDLRASLVVPMHAFGSASLQRFIAGMTEDFEIRFAQDRTIRVSLETLPRQPTVLVPQRY